MTIILYGPCHPSECTIQVGEFIGKISEHIILTFSELYLGLYYLSPSCGQRLEKITLITYFEGSRYCIFYS